MPRQSAEPREGLIPKVITDVNGNTKTVWVRPDVYDSYAEDNDFNRVPPIRKRQQEEEELKPMHTPVGEKQGSLRHTREEKARAFERGYGSDRLRAAAESRFLSEFGVPMSEAPPVVLSNEQLYDYIARGLTIEQAQEFAEFGIEPHLTHPKADAEYAFVAGPKVAKIDLKYQQASDSYLRRKELGDIHRTARGLQDMEVDPEIAAKCIANGLRSSHINNKKWDVKKVIEASSVHNVESKEFQEAVKEQRPGLRDGAKRKVREMGVRARRAVWRGTKRWVRRRARRIYNSISRRFARLLRRTFLPWKTR